jgi:flagellar hook-associated protein 2
MASITSLGVGSGLDLEGMLTKLMTVEQQPLTVLQKRVASYQSRISSLGTLQSALSNLQTAAAALTPSTGQTAINKFSSYGASLADAALANASASTGAIAGSYSLNNIVVATAQQIRKSWSGLSVPATAGTLSIQVGTGAAVNVDIAAGSALADVSEAINNSSAGISAAIVNDGTNNHLVLTAKDTGTANAITITGSDVAGGTGWTGGPFDFSSTVANSWTQSIPAANATLDVNGIAVSSASNTLTTAISGVTLNLTKAGSTTLTVSKDSTTGLTTSLNAFVTAYNAANTSMGALGTYNPSTKISGALQGDAALRTAQSQVRGLLFSTVAGGSSVYQRLSDIGVSVARDGTLSVDSTKLNKAISADYAGVATLVAKVGTSYKTSLESITGTSGTLVAATNSSTRMIKDLTARQTTLSDRLTQIEANYRKQFTALDTLVASLNKTSTYLTQQLTALASLTNNANSSSN